MGVSKLVSCSWYLREPSDRNASYDCTVAISYYSFNESTLCSALRLTEALYQHWSCTSELTLLSRALADDAVLFQAFAALPEEGQPTSSQLVLLHHFFFQIPQLWPGMHSPCTLLCPGQPDVLLQMNVVGWSVNTAVCSDRECLQAVCTALLIYPPQPLQDQLLLYHSG